MKFPNFLTQIANLMAFEMSYGREIKRIELSSICWENTKGQFTQYTKYTSEVLCEIYGIPVTIVDDAEHWYKIIV